MAGKILRSFGLQHALLGILAIAAISMASFALFRIPANVADSASQPYMAPSPAAPTPTPTVDPAVMLTAIQGLVAGSEPLTISVLGDSTGNARGEWVDLWARDLTAHGTVTLNQWDQTANAWMPAPTVYAGGQRTITIWNGSHPGSNYTYPLARMETIQPEKPSFVILNFGHNGSPKRVDAGSMDLLAAVSAKWGETPVAITLQNPARNVREPITAASVDVLREWAPRVGYATIDVYTAFKNAGPLEALLVDDVHPNPAGARVWADTVKATLG